MRTRHGSDEELRGNGGAKRRWRQQAPGRAVSFAAGKRWKGEKAAGVYEGGSAPCINSEKGSEA